MQLAFTMIKASAINKMLRDGNLVRKLAVCEKLGNVDFICTDKTGVLTQNKFGLELMWNKD